MFDYSQRKSCRHQWDPFVSKIVSDGAMDLPELGTQVTVWTWNQLQVTCRYIQFQRPSCIAIQMTSGPSILKAFGGTWRFTARDAGTTEITFAYNFVLIASMKWLSPIAKLYFSWDMKRRLTTLTTHGASAYARFLSSSVPPWSTSSEPAEKSIASF